MQKVVSDNVIQNLPQDVSRMTFEEIENMIRVNGNTTQETTKETTREKNNIKEWIVLLVKDNLSITAEQIASEIKKIGV